MRPRGLFFALCGWLALAPASAQQSETAPPTNIVQPAAAPIAPPSDVGATAAERLEEAVAFFLFDAMTVRSKLRSQGLEERADRFWQSSSKFVELVTAADTELAPQFLPILDGFRRSLKETALDPANVDLEGLAGILGALDDQNEIYQAPGAFEGGRSMIQVEVRALRAGQPVNGLYVWLDLAGSVPKGATANSLTNMTSPAKGVVGPGKYVVRIISEGREVARRPDMRVGRNGNKEIIDVLVP